MISETTTRYNGVGTRALSVTGSGTPILLLHGYADSADTWRGVLRELERRGRTAYAVDLPGFGLADPRLPGPLTPQFEAFVDALVSDLGPVVLVGNSLGAATALRAAARAADDSVAAVVTLDEPLMARHWLSRAARLSDFAWFFRLVAALPVPDQVVHWCVRRAVGLVVYGPGHRADAEFLATATRSIPDMRAAAARGGDAIRYARENPDGHSELPLDRPLLILHGAQDRIIPVAAAHALHALLPTSELTILPGVGHCPQLDVPHQIAQLILDFLARTTENRSATG
ncbi:alpha/beta hydrolase [Nocardia sp. NPDC048505]|uniref:alpha/beta fold hydrolase n=1 Tax=unclassified Nocardia TaxID=2637762 RepID=UPI003406233B